MSTAPTGTLTAKIIYDVDSAIAQSVRLGEVTEKQGQRVVRQVAEINSIFKTLTSSQSVAADVVGKAVSQQSMLAKSTKETAWAMRTVPAQMTDVFTQLAGGANPMMVLIQQGGQLKDVFGGFGPMFRGLAEYLTIGRIAFTAAAGAVGALAMAMYEGYQASEAFAKSLIATGNYSGMTSSRFDQMAESAVRLTGATQGAAREALQALITTGRVGQDAIGPALVALLNMQSVTGQTSDEVSKNFGRMGDDVAKWAAETNKSVHFLTEGQFRYIKSLQDKGKVEEAQIATYRALADHHKRNAEGLGYIEQALKAIKATASDAWQALMKFGAPINTGAGIKDLQNQITTILNASGGKEPAAETYSAGRIQALRQQLYGLAQKATAEAAAATAVASAAAANEKKIAAIQAPPKRGNSGPTGPDAYQRMLSDITKYREQSELMAGTQQRVSEADRWAAEMRDRLRDATLKMTPAQEAATTAAIKAAAAERAQSENVVAARNARVAALMEETAESERQQGKVDDFIRSYNEMYAAIHQEGEEIGKTARELERLNALRKIDMDFQKASANASVDTQVKLQRERDKAKAEIEAALRARNDAQDAYKSDPRNGEQEALRKYIEDAANMAQFTENIINGSLKRAEDAFINFAKTGKASLGDLFGYMAEEYLRQMFRMQMADTMKGAGGGFSLANIFSKAISWGANLFSGHANGLAYVPYDNYPAMLHEGEKVLTKQDAAAGNSGGNVYHQNFNIGHGVTPQQVQMAMTEARRGAVAQAKGEIMQSIRRQGAFSQ